jgi:hypothetical protein
VARVIDQYFQVREALLVAIFFLKNFPPRRTSARLACALQLAIIRSGYSQLFAEPGVPRTLRLIAFHLGASWSC